MKHVNNASQYNSFQSLDSNVLYFNSIQQHANNALQQESFQLVELNVSESNTTVLNITVLNAIKQQTTSYSRL